MDEPEGGSLVTPLRPPRRLAAAYGGGGPFGIAYGLGVADALLDAGVPLRETESIGTSAGSWVASCLVTGTEFETLCAVPEVRVPNPTPGLLRGIATELFGDARSPLVTATAVRVPTGRRVLLSGADHPLAAIVAASSAVPWLFAPVRLGGRLFADGGVRSMVHADHALAADHLLVVAPIAGPMFGPGGRAMELMLRNELGRWQRSTGGKAHLIRPDREIASLARHPLDLFDKQRAAAVYPLAYAQATRLLATRDGLSGLAVREELPA
jgi:predicted acylesterase/phospholipase RssA